MPVVPGHNGLLGTQPMQHALSMQHTLGQTPLQPGPMHTLSLPHTPWGSQLQQAAPAQPQTAKLLMLQKAKLLLQQKEQLMKRKQQEQDVRSVSPLARSSKPIPPPPLTLPLDLFDASVPTLDVSLTWDCLQACSHWLPPSTSQHTHHHHHHACKHARLPSPCTAQHSRAHRTHN